MAWILKKENRKVDTMGYIREFHDKATGLGLGFAIVPGAKPGPEVCQCTHADERHVVLLLPAPGMSPWKCQAGITVDGIEYQCVCREPRY